MLTGPEAKTTTSNPRRAPTQAATVAFVPLFVLLAWVSDVRPLYELHVSPWSPQWGLALAFLLEFGFGGIAGVAVAALTSEIVLGHASPQAGATYIGALWLTGCHALLATIWRRFLARNDAANASQVVRLGAASALGMLVAALGYAGVHAAAGTLPTSEILPAGTRLWIGGLNGMLVIAPLLTLGLQGRDRLRINRADATDLAVRLAIVVLTLGVAFMLPAADQLRFFYLLFVPVVWIALRWQWRGALMAVLLIQFGLLIVAEARIPTARFIDLQFFLLVLTLTGLLLGLVVAERANALARVEAAEAEHRALLAMAPDAILVTDSRGVTRNLNAAANRLFGSDALGAPVDRLIGELRIVGDEGRAALTGRSGDGGSFPAEVAWARQPATDGGYLVVVRDVTERRRAEAELRERDAALAGAMRFAVAGEMSSALAHELNQPITALVSYLRACEILASAGGDDERLRVTLDKSVREAIRASDVLHRLRDFYQGGLPRRETVRLSELCRSVLATFVDRQERAEARIEFVDDPTLPLVAVDPTQFEIVLHNLLANSLEAVLRAPTARRISLSLTHDAQTVAITVEDSGPGVPQEMQRKLFDPFVTDKPDGMGLGLAICQSLVRANGGDLALVPGGVLGGARFVIRVPVRFPAAGSAS